MPCDDLTVGMVYPSLGHAPTRTHATEYGHPSHRGFARAVGADDLVMARRALPAPVRDTVLADAYAALACRLPERDVYVLENDTVLYLAPVLARRYPGSTILHLAASDRLLGRITVRRSDEPWLRAEKRRLNRRADTSLLRAILTRYCDGAVAVSSFARERIRSFAGPAFPVRVVEPYVQPALYDSLPAVEPALQSNTAVTVGTWRDHKGIDRLVAAWPLVRERHPDAKLRIVGQHHPAEYADTLGVTLQGFVDSLADELRAASLYVHPAAIEAFGVSVVEAMRAGLPAVVTETTGARSAVGAVDRSLVVPPTPRALAAGVSAYFDADLDRRRALSRASRETSAAYDEATKTRAFRRAFDALVGRRADTGAIAR